MKISNRTRGSVVGQSFRCEAQDSGSFPYIKFYSFLRRIALRELYVVYVLYMYAGTDFCTNRDRHRERYKSMDKLLLAVIHFKP